MIGQPLLRTPPPDARWIRRSALAWFRTDGRVFPWRETTDTYAVLVAELLLQRTRADLVEPIYGRFLARYPDAAALAHADVAEVAELLRPLGFKHRSARLPLLARALTERHGGKVPRSLSSLMALPGVGRYVSNAVLAIGFRERRPLLDPNVLRLLGRVFAERSSRPRARDDSKMWAFVEELLPRRGAREFSLALVDLGSVVCRARRPRCLECPLRSRCIAFAAGAVIPAQPTPGERRPPVARSAQRLSR